MLSIAMKQILHISQAMSNCNSSFNEFIPNYSWTNENTIKPHLKKLITRAKIYTIYLIFAHVPILPEINQVWHKSKHFYKSII